MEFKSDDTVNSSSGQSVQPEPKVESHPIVVETQPEQKQKVSRQRNYSFKNKKAETFDAVTVDGVEQRIPAPIGSSYWAVLKVFFTHAYKPVYIPDLLREVEELMKDRDEDKWNRYIGKQNATVYRKCEGERSIQKIKPWEERIVNNAKTLTRMGGKSPYGLRLAEVGHGLQHHYDGDMKPYFILVKTA